MINIYLKNYKYILIYLNLDNVNYLM